MLDFYYISPKLGLARADFLKDFGHFIIVVSLEDARNKPRMNTNPLLTIAQKYF